jgi:hypothetical protein
MQIEIIAAEMNHSTESGYVGYVAFQVEGHGQPYALHLRSKNTRDWDYSLLFANESGKEEHILKVEEVLDNEEDDTFDRLIEAAMRALPQ